MQFCKVFLESEEGFTVGIQLLQMQGIQPSRSYCAIEVFTYPERNGAAFCLWNMTANKEISSVINKLELLFEFNQPNFVSGAIVDVLYYSFTQSDSDGNCGRSDTDVCERSSRCVRLSVLEYVKQYNICQSSSNNNGDNVVEEEASYFGVAVFAGTLIFLLFILIGLQAVHSKNICRTIRGFCLGADEDDDGRSGRPQFTLDGPPPSYSDLSSIDSFQNRDVNQIEPSPTDPGINLRSQGTIPTLDPNVQRNVSAGGLSVASTLPPSYSDVIVHQDKYDVHQ